MTDDKDKKEVGSATPDWLFVYLSEKFGAAAGMALFGDAAMGAIVGECAGGVTAQWMKNNLGRIFAKVKPLISGKKIHPLPPKMALAFVEAASKEDDEDLQTLWANLLSKYLVEGVDRRESFVRILSRLSPIEAKIFNALYIYARTLKPEERWDKGFLKEDSTQNEVDKGIKSWYKLSEEDYVVAYQNMLNMGIIDTLSQKLGFVDPPDIKYIIRGNSRLIISDLGFAFGDYVIAPGLPEEKNGG